ncbi:MAG: hydroxymethylglutaryl-CoA lyase [Bacteroidota bacterium]
MIHRKIHITECPRDAMQGIKEFIPTDLKVSYLNALLKVGYDRLDFGSFVSSKAIPQMVDTPAIVERLEVEETGTDLSCIVVNERGATTACSYSQIQFLGYPFSISETFQIRNTRKTIQESVRILDSIQNLCVKHNKSLLVYLSMAFGNPYEDEWSIELLSDWAEQMSNMGVSDIALADTVGRANAEQVQSVFSPLLTAYPRIQWSAHLHAHPKDRMKLIDAAYQSGCRRFESAISGFGGCPFAKDELVGNLATESVLEYASQKNLKLGLDQQAFRKAVDISRLVFS